MQLSWWITTLRGAIYAANDPSVLKKIWKSLRKRGLKRTLALAVAKASPSSGLLYDAAFKKSVLNLSTLKTTLDEVTFCPKISIVMPVYKVDTRYLRLAIESVRSQIYPNWELCICDDHSESHKVTALLRSYEQVDARVKFVESSINVGISGATNMAIELATGDYVGFLDHDDELSPDALARIVLELNAHRWDIVYSDEDKIDAKGNLRDPFCKPDWSPDLLYSHNYVTHFCVYSRWLIDALEGCREGFEGSQDYDLLLRATELTNSIGHVPYVLYHWRTLDTSTASSSDAKPYAYENAVRALQDHFDRSYPGTVVIHGSILGYYRVTFPLTSTPLVSIIIPVRDKIHLLETCIDSILNKTTYRHYEIIIVNNGSEEEISLEYLKRLSRNKSVKKVVDAPGPFNFSLLNNIGVRETAGEVLLFLNSDTEVIEPTWLTEMVSHAIRPEIGCVGAKLLYKDDKVQHAGVVLGLGGLAAHSHRGFGRDDYGYFGTLISLRNYSATTAACLMVRKDVFLQVGGFNEQDLPINYNDVDFSLKVADLGLRNLVTPHATLYHYESASRVPIIDEQEILYMQTMWGDKIRRDPYYNPHLTTAREDFSFEVDSLQDFDSNTTTHNGLIAERLFPMFKNAVASEFGSESEQVALAMVAIWRVYHTRPDLRRAFPIGQPGALNQLIEWAIQFGSGPDSASPYLRPHEKTFGHILNGIQKAPEMANGLSLIFG